MAKIALLFIIVMAIIAIIGRIRLPELLRKRNRLQLARKCPHCGAHVFKGIDCPCRSSS